ncbi:hypothetical protein HYX19_04905 [Candidatus Woesearchaeota archaeon]|nr:hypothetical protein [Candidatus Woesearchaeota archaeon]
MNKPIFVKAEFKDGSKVIVRYDQLPKARDRFNIVYWGPEPENSFERMRLKGRQDGENRIYHAYKMRSGTYCRDGVTFISIDEVPQNLAEKRDALRKIMHGIIEISQAPNLEEQLREYIREEQK